MRLQFYAFEMEITLLYKIIINIGRYKNPILILGHQHLYVCNVDNQSKLDDNKYTRRTFDHRKRVYN